MEDNQKPDPSKTALTVVRTEVAKTQEQLDDELRAEMTADLNAGFSAVAINELLASPMVGKYINQARPFLPMINKEVHKYFGADKVRIMIYLDEETGALVFQKMETENIKALDWHVEPEAKDFFILEKKDLENPEGFIKKMQQKFNFKLF